jgi:putative ABC transport system permease protein
MRSTAFKIALRDLRSSWSKFLFVVLAVGAGVGALTGVRGFSEAFGVMLLKEARALTAADISARIFAHPTAEQQAAIDSLVRRGVQWTQVTETVSMISADPAPVPVLVSVKAVDPNRFPFYGQVTLEPARILRETLTGGAVAVSDDLLLRTATKLGDTIRAGSATFRIAAVISEEPDRMSGAFSVGPRMMMTREDLERTGLIGLGSRATQRMLFRLPPRSVPIETVHAELKRAFPEAMIVDYREMNPNIARGLRRATTFLSLVSLVAVVIGAIGVATAMRAHLQTRLDSVAIMKSLGARSSQILRIYLIETVLLGTVGGLLGIAIGAAAQQVFPHLIQRFFQVRPDTALSATASAQGLVIGLLITVLFTLPPLLGIAQIRPALILRREMPEVKLTLKQRLRRAGRGLILSVIASALLIAATVALVASSWRDALEIGTLFVGSLAVSLLILAATGWALLRALQIVVARTPTMPATLRHALANLYRPGSQSRSVLTALGVGVMFTFTVHLVQKSVLDEVQRNTPPGMPNVFFLDITPEQQPGIAGMLREHPGVSKEPEIIGTVSSRLVAINGVPMDQVKLSDGMSRRYRMARAITKETRRPDGTEVVQGKWWDKPSTPQISVSEFTARRLNLKPGSTMTWSSFGRTIDATVAAVHKTESQRLRAANDFHMNAEALDGLPTVYYAAARVAPDQIGALQRTSVRRFPTVTLINIAEILDRMQQIVDQIAVVIRFISFFAIFAGAVILASSVAGTRFRRVREMAVFKTLGATRSRIAGMLSVEFLVLGIVAGLIGSLLANVFTWLALKRFFDAVPFRMDPPALVVAVLASALIAAASGWLASFRILGQKPMEVLRGE